MANFKPGDVVRTKGGGGPKMTVDGYTPSGEVICTYWVSGSRKQENFVEATLEAVPTSRGPILINPKPPRY